MKYTQIPTNEDVHVFWSEDSSEETVIVEIGNDLIDFHQYENWVTISKETLIKIVNIINK